MNAEELIKSGKLELYVAGALCGKEARQVADMISADPVLQREVRSIEEAMLASLREGGVAPRAEVKGKVMAALNKKLPVDGDGRANNFTGPVAGARVVPMNAINVWLAAASVLLLLALSATYYVLNKKIVLQQSQMAALKTQYNSQLASNAKYSEELALINHHLTKKIVLNGVATTPDARAIVYWNTLNHRVIVSPTGLPAPPEGKQYQLWAMLNGKPVDAGVFDMNNDTIKLEEVKHIANAQAFAITLEQKGGASTPTLSAMYVMGNI